MIRSMTGFGSKEIESAKLGKVSVELRSTNHKFLETVIHLPEGLLVLEDRIKRTVEAKLKRGRVTCVVSLNGRKTGSVHVNQEVMGKYMAAIKQIKQRFKLAEEPGLDTILHLPGVLSLEEEGGNKLSNWPPIKAVLSKALMDLVKMRQKEGGALAVVMARHLDAMKDRISRIKIRFQQAARDKLKGLEACEERSAFLKESDIAEEMDRLNFHIRNFRSKLKISAAVGKELDFIAQEMQREANTLSAKSFDPEVSAQAVQLKSVVEKIREQVQNIE